MWALTMMVLTGLVLSSSLYFGAAEILRATEVRLSADASAVLQHKHSLVQYVQGCRNPSLNTACPVEPVSGQEISTPTLQQGGVGGLSVQWSAYWDAQQTMLYLYPADRSAQLDLLNDLRSQGSQSLLLGTVRLEPFEAQLDSAQTDGRRMRLPGFFLSDAAYAGMMIWAVPLPKS